MLGQLLTCGLRVQSVSGDGELRECAQVEKIFREWCLPRVYTINRVEGLYLRAQGLHDGVLGFPGAGSAM